MTVLSRGARVRRGGRRPGWVLLTTLLVLAIGASSALVFTDRVELLKLAVILALWAAVAGAFVSVLYRRQAEADQARARDMKLVYDLRLDREISARREYELTVESQLRRELAAEIHAQAADEIAALRAELSSLRTSLEILFDTDLEQRPALETLDRESARALTDRASRGAQNGEIPPADWVTSDRVTAVRRDDRPTRADDSAIIDVPEEPLVPPRPPAPPREYTPPPAPQPRSSSPNRLSSSPNRRSSSPSRLSRSLSRPSRSRNRGSRRVIGRRRSRHQRPHRRSPRRGSRSPPRASGCRPVRRAATGHPAKPPGPGAVRTAPARPALGTPGRRDAVRWRQCAAGRLYPSRCSRRRRPARRRHRPAGRHRTRIRRSPFAIPPLGGIPPVRGRQFRPPARGRVGAPRRRAAAAAGVSGTRAGAAPTGPAAGSPASQRRGDREHAGPGRPGIRWPDGRGPDGAAAGAARRRWPPAPA